MQLHNADKMFDNFSFVNESKIIEQTQESDQAHGLSLRRNSFDDDFPVASMTEIKESEE